MITRRAHQSVHATHMMSAVDQQTQRQTTVNPTLEIHRTCHNCSPTDT